ncbi:MAG: septum formation initiator family protein, partial [Gaiellales bacterium]
KTRTPGRRPARSATALRWIGAIVLIGVAFSYIHPVRSYREARRDVERKEAQLEALTRKRDNLERRLEFATTDAFIEQEARTHGLARAGETLFLVQGVERWQKNRNR